MQGVFWYIKIHIIKLAKENALQLDKKGGSGMDITNVDYIMNIFRTVAGELPEQMLYRENGDNIELRIPDGIGNCFPADLQGNGWSLIGTQMAEAA